MVRVMSKYYVILILFLPTLSFCQMVLSMEPTNIEGLRVTHLATETDKIYWMGGMFDQPIALDTIEILNHGADDVFIAQMNDDVIQQYFVLGSNSDDFLADMIVTDDGIWIYGHFWDSLYVNSELTAISSYGKSLFALNWIEDEVAHLIQIDGNRFKEPVTIEPSTHGLIVLANFRDSLLIKDSVYFSSFNTSFCGLFDWQGQLIDGIVFPGSGKIQAADAIVRSDEVIIGGSFQGSINSDGKEIKTNTLDDDGWVATFSMPTLKIESLQRFGGVFEDRVTHLEYYEDTLVVAGYFIGRVELNEMGTLLSNGFERDIFQFYLSPSMQLIRSTSIGGFGDEVLSELKVLDNRLWWIGQSTMEFDWNGRPIQNSDGQPHAFIISEGSEESSSWAVADTGIGSTMLYSMIPYKDSIARLAGSYIGAPIFSEVNDLPMAANDQSFFLDMLIHSKSIQPNFNSIVIFPNPTRSDLNIFSPETISELVIYDLQGRMYMRVQSNKKIPTRNLVPGYYLLNIKLIDGRFETIPFIKL